MEVGVLDRRRLALSGATHVTRVRPLITVLYHYLHPDDVISARLFDELCEGLVERGWDVEAMPSNRGCRDEARSYPLRETWHGIDYRRVWRPPLPQSTRLGRIVNASCLVAAWSAIAARRPTRLPDVVLVGTDPILSVCVAPIIKRLRPRVRIAHWVHDLYPEAAAADGLLDPHGAAYRALRRLATRAYRSCDLIVDLGEHMRERLSDHGHRATRATIPPWALHEPPEPLEPDRALRQRLFGAARLALLYSGNFGRAHDFEHLLELARLLRHDGVHLCFAVRGNRVDELRAAVRPDDTNVSFAPFASEADLAAHLAAADVHVVTLRPEWSGIVVPSKFFGALAIGRPMLFVGPRSSDLARCILSLGLGWVQGPGEARDVAMALRREASKSMAERAAHHRVCWRVYREHFSRDIALARWTDLLASLTGTGPSAPGASSSSRRPEY